MIKPTKEQRDALTALTEGEPSTDSIFEPMPKEVIGSFYFFMQGFKYGFVIMGLVWLALYVGAHI